MINKTKLFFVLLIGIPISVWAKSDKLEKDLQHCFHVSDNVARLACYDKVSSAFAIAPMSIVKPVEKAKAPVVKQTKEMATVKEATVVASVPIVTTTATAKVKTTPQTPATQVDAVDDFGKKHIKTVTPDDDKTIEFVIAKIKKLAFDNLQLTFENGQLWRQKDSIKIRLRVGDTVKLSYGVGSAIYLQKVGKNKRIRVKRIK